MFNCYALISGHPSGGGGGNPGNPRAFAQRCLQIPQPRNNISPQKAIIVTPPGDTLV